MTKRKCKNALNSKLYIGFLFIVMVLSMALGVLSIKNSSKLAMADGTVYNAQNAEVSVWDGTGLDVTSYTFSGKGTESNPYLIQSATDLAALSALSKGKHYGANQYYKLTVNIDLSGYNWQPICHDEEGSEYYFFKGNFDGNGKYVKLNASANYSGLFRGYGTYNESTTVTLKDLTIKGSVSGSTWTGGVASYASGAIFSNVVNEANITNTQNTYSYNDTGGLVGRISIDGKVSFINCVNNGIVNGDKRVGGFVGFVRKGAVVSFNGCKNIASVTGNQYIGGYIGHAYAEDNLSKITIIINNSIVELGNEESISTPNNIATPSKISGNSDNEYVGWLVGYSESSQTESFNGYTVYWVNDNTILETDINTASDTTLNYGVTSTYNGETPYRYGHVFTGWDLKISTYNKTITYIAQFSDTDIWDGTGLDVISYTFSGEGTKNNPYLIQSAKDLAALSALSKGQNYGEGQYYKLTVNIDLSGYNWQPICFDEENTTYFNGNFDGNGKYINLNVVNTKSGLFAGFGSNSNTTNATLQDLTIKGNVTGSNWSGGAASYASGAVFSNVVNEANITNTKTTHGYNDAGGIVGRIALGKNATFINCVNKGVVTSLRNTGGIVGVIRSGSIIVFENCQNYASVICGSQNVGGIVGYAEDSSSSMLTLIMNNCLVELENGESISSANYVTTSSELLGKSTNEYAGWIVGYNDVSTIVFNENDYTIKWIDGETILKTITNASYNTNTSYNGEIPYRYGYVFTGWATEVSVENKTITYTAQFSDTDIWDGTGLDVTSYTFSGEGTANNPYLIQSAKDLAALSALSKGQNYGEGQYYKLTVNIDLSGYNWQPICYDEENNIYFKGNFDGNGKYVNLKVVNTKSGLFAGFGSNSNTINATLQDLTIKGNVRGSLWAGGAASYVAGAIFSNVVNEANITNTKTTYGDNDTGGVVGRIALGKNATFINCINKGVVTSLRNAGGIVGVVRGDSIGVFENCKNFASVITTMENSGGIVGYGEIYQGSPLFGKVVINNCIVELDGIEEISAAERKASSSQLLGEEAPYVGWLVGCGETSYLFFDYVYEIEYDGNGSTSGEMAKSGEISYGTIEQLAKNQFTKTGYTFVGWKCSVTGGFYGTTLSEVTTLIENSTIIPDLAYVTQLINVSGGTVTFTAQWQINTYIVTWVVDGKTTTTEVEYGEMPNYGSTPTKASNAQYTYTFTGWSPKLDVVTGDITYVAQFNSTLNSYTITWKNGNETLKTETLVYGSLPNYTGETPTKVETVELTFTFNGWSPSVKEVTGDATYIAIFTENARLYTITWVIEGQITTTQVAYGTLPTYNGTPTKAPTKEHAYSFTGWDTTPVKVTGDATYTAQFKQISVAFYSLTVKETIGINFYLDVKKYTEDVNAYVELEYNHNAINYVPDVCIDRIYIYSATQSQGMYKFSLSFASGQIADEINIRLYSQSGELLFNKLNLSILSYCNTIIESNQNARLVKLCKSIIDYGKYAKEYFGYKPEVEINNSGLELPQSITQEHLLQGLTQQDITTEEQLIANKEVTNISFIRYSFVALSDVSIRIYFDILNGGTLDDYNITLTKPAVPTDMDIKTDSNDWGFFVEIYGIESNNINKIFTVTITNKSDESSTSITYSALNYIDNVIQKIGNSQDEKLLRQKNMCLAIYQYNLCAIDYFRIEDPWEIL